ncbi:OmpA family protein [Permianibacter sp. IMCC34836]|uniref:OmpA family protein n=1 Tax=Permianibacter fluminis TaxID=2738515 RepID=UPI001556E9A7|nr:OmpA family protein [Permianibacter fluminis]NQD36891.1 OmpA family protein [Permianibacter fluminis]
MTRIIRQWFLLVTIALSGLLNLGVAQAGDDITGSKDHPMLQRWPQSFITDYSKQFNAVELAVGKKANGDADRQSKEGMLTSIRYFYDQANQPSALQLLRNYQNAIKAINGKVVYERLPRDGDGGEITLQAAVDGKDVWIQVLPEIYSAPTQSYLLNILEIEGMQQVVSANAMLDEMNKTGLVTLYINFDTGKSELKADGKAVIKEIVGMMKLAPQLKIEVGGHTDNVGQPAANKTLSQARAQTVMKAIVDGGIAANRLTAAGYGQEYPIGDNRTEAGKAKNRRVELVKK